MKQVLIVEDQASDLRIAAEIAESAGFSRVEGRTSAETARFFLEKGMDGQETLPDAIVLDLDLGHDSGFELLRFWHSHPPLAKIPLVVWSVFGDRFREVCQVFHIRAYIDKGEDLSTLRAALSGLAKAD